ncbi:MAG: hypothetical protein MR601_03785 [Erysipelotrichaceae bacterium]|nr:hypothetical protein [Erysipelotrichaceae bacterium]
MKELTSKELKVLYLRKVECYSQEEIAVKLNYFIRQVQRIQKSAEEKIINSFMPNIIETYKKEVS